MWHAMVTLSGLFGRFVLDTDASLFAVGGGGCLNQLQDDREVVIAYTSRGLRLSHRRYCTTRQEMLTAVVMCTHFQSYLRGGGLSSPFTQTTAPSDGCKSSAMKMECWPVGTCCWDSFRLPLSIVRGPACQCGCSANAASVRGRIVQFPHLTRR